MAPKNFFETMRTKYGNYLVTTMKELFKIKVKLAKAQNKKLFLLRCRKERVFPNNRRLKNSANINKMVFHKLESRFIFSVINQEIAENFLRINKLDKLVIQKFQQIKTIISPYYFKNFTSKLENNFKFRYDYIKAINIRKFNNIYHNYSNNYNTTVDHPHDSVNNNITPSIDSNVDNNKWLVNLSEIEIPNKITDVLKLGEQFCPPLSGKFVPYKHIIANIEGALIDNTDENLDKPRIRNELVNILTNFKNYTKHKNLLTPIKSSFIKDISSTKKFIKDHPEILITRADKGNTTVIVSKIDYTNKINSMLQDISTYTPINKNNTASIQRKLNQMVTTWHKESAISDYEAKYLHNYHGVVAKLYGLPKIHKINTPFRPIVSSIGTPLYNLSSFLSVILNKTVGKSFTAVKNSAEFKDKIKNIILPKDHIILSLDVISLFTNIDSLLVLHLLSEKWTTIKRNSSTKLKKTQYISAMQLVLQNCEFSFNNQSYRQVFGSPMGSPVSPAVANLVMEFIESNVLCSLDFKPMFFFRYVDDIITAIPINKVDTFFNAFNAFNSNVKFTMELENNHQLAFLDLVIIHNLDGSLSTDWFHKSTWSGRYLNFDSHLPLSYKRNTVKLLANKIIQLSDPIFHKNNFQLLSKTLLNNGYPNSFINPILKFSLNSANHNNHSTEINPLLTENQIKYISVPYVHSLHEKLSFCLNKFNFKLVGKSYNNFGKSLFSSLKDPTLLGNNKDIVYKVRCECDKVYIGQTKQLLSTRFCQHKRDAQKLTIKKVAHDATSALSAHLYETKHNIFLDNVDILEHETNHSTRRVLEMIHIKTNPDSINKQSDCNYLQNTYNHLIK